MRIMTSALAVACVVLIGGQASAVEYPWCAQYGVQGGATNCGFASMEQCRAAISGVGGFCRANLFYGGAVAGVAVRPHHKRHHRLARR